MKRAKYSFRSRNKLERAKELTEKRYPDLKLRCLNDQVDEDGCKHIMFIDSVDSTLFDVDLSIFLEKLGGKFIENLPITL